MSSAFHIYKRSWSFSGGVGAIVRWLSRRSREDAWMSLRSVLLVSVIWFWSVRVDQSAKESVT